MSALSRNDDVELVGAVDRSRETTATRVIRVADVREDAVEDHRKLSVVLDRAEVVRQTHEESHANTFLRRNSCS